MADIASRNVSMQLKMANGRNEDGSVKYQTRSISGINPDISVDDFSAAADAVCSLFSTACHGVHRVTSEDIL